MKKSKSILLALILSPIILATGGLLLIPKDTLSDPLDAYAKKELVCAFVPKIMSRYLKHHVVYNNLDLKTLPAQLKERTLESYVKRINPSKSLLLENEAKQIKDQVAKVFSSMMKDQPDCKVLFDVQQTIIANSKQAESHVKKITADAKLKIDDNIELVSDPDKRPYPKTSTERDELLRKFVHFQLSNYIDAGTEMAEARDLIKHRYELNTKREIEKNEEEVLSEFILAFSNSLDPHSSYFSPDALEDFNISMKLSLEGIGVTLSSRDGYTIVEEIIPGGAAGRAGVLKTKDKIVSVSQGGDSQPVNIIDMRLRDVVKLIRGAKGSTVTLTLLREEGKEKVRKTVNIIRDTIDLKEQAARLEVEDVVHENRKMKLAYIDLPSFYGDKDPSKRSSYTDVRDLLKEANTKGSDGLVLDLTRNGGGLLDDAVKISGLFLAEGGMVATQSAEERPVILYDRDEEIHYSKPVIVLVSRLSASASEIVAGALKDYNRAVIVGDKNTFGKGTVQSVLHLFPGLGALKVTTGLFFRPGGQSTQQHGVEADIRLPSIFDSDEYAEAGLDYSLPGTKIKSFTGSSANTSDSAKKFKVITSSTIQHLNSKVGPRLASNEEFKKITKQLEEAKQKKNTIRLGDVRGEKNEDKKKLNKDGHIPEDNMEVSRKEDKNKKTEQHKEAMRILADLIYLQNPEAGKLADKNEIIQKNPAN